MREQDRTASQASIDRVLLTYCNIFQRFTSVSFVLFSQLLFRCVVTAAGGSCGGRCATRGECNQAMCVCARGECSRPKGFHSGVLYRRKRTFSTATPTRSMRRRVCVPETHWHTIKGNESTYSVRLLEYIFMTESNVSDSLSLSTPSSVLEARRSGRNVCG